MDLTVRLEQLGMPTLEEVTARFGPDADDAARKDQASGLVRQRISGTTAQRPVYDFRFGTARQISRGRATGAAVKKVAHRRQE